MQRKTTGERRKPTPAWAVNDQKLQEVIARYVEGRAGFTFAQPGTLQERIVRAEDRLKAKAAKSWQVLTKLNAEYCNAETTPARKAQLVPIIRGLNSARIVDNHPAAVAAACVWLYYRAAQDSVGVGAELDLRPPAVRQLLLRLNCVARGLTAGGKVRRIGKCAFCKKPIAGRANRCETCKEAAYIHSLQKAKDLRAKVALAAQAAERQLTQPRPRLCSVCGGAMPKRHRKICGSEKCKRTHRRKAAAARRASIRRAFCSPVCREIGKNLPVDLKERFAAPEDALDSGGDKSFESYLRVATMTGVAPMSFELWSQLR